MTISEAIKSALLKTDSEREDYENEVYYIAADEAQKKIALYGRHIKRYIKVVSDDYETKTIDLNENGDFYRLCYIKREGNSGTVSYHISQGKTLVLKDKGEFEICYFAMPKTINTDTPDDYEFETDLETHAAIPFYIGYELVKTDDTTLAQMLLNEWNRYLSLFEDDKKVITKRINNPYARW